MESIEKIINPETLQLYTTRYEEKHNIASDELHVYVVWSKLKQLSLEDKPTTEPTPIDKEVILWLSCLRSSRKFHLFLKKC